MTSDPKAPPPVKGDSAKAAREKRLAEALRQNLRRRKAAAKAAETAAGTKGKAPPDR